jgi:hypothetical protein
MLNDSHQLLAGRPIGRRLVLRWLGWTLCSVCFLGGSVAQDAVFDEYQVKAAYLYNFAKFVEWPPECFTNSQAPLVISVFGENPFRNEFNAIVKEHKINGRDIRFKPVTTVAAATGVQVMFFTAAEDDHIAETLAALKGRGVLTVGESKKFIASGGAINFVRVADTVRFEVNVAAAEQQGLKLSAQMLKVAIAIYKAPPGNP